METGSSSRRPETSERTSASYRLRLFAAFWRNKLKSSALRRDLPLFSKLDSGRIFVEGAVRMSWSTVPWTTHMEVFANRERDAGTSETFLSDTEKTITAVATCSSPKAWNYEIQPPAYSKDRSLRRTPGEHPPPVGSLLLSQSSDDFQGREHGTKVARERRLIRSVEPAMDAAEANLQLERKFGWGMMISRFVECGFAFIVFVTLAVSGSFSLAPAFAALMASGIIAFVGCLSLGCMEWLLIGISYDEEKILLRRKIRHARTYANLLYDSTVGFLSLGSACASAGLLTAGADVGIGCGDNSCRPLDVSTAMLFCLAFLLLTSLSFSYWKFRGKRLKVFTTQQAEAGSTANASEENNWQHSFGFSCFLRSLQVALAATIIGIFASINEKSKAPAFEYSLAVGIICLLLSSGLLSLEAYCAGKKLTSYPLWFGNHAFLMAELAYDIVLVIFSLSAASASAGVVYMDCAVPGFNCSMGHAGVAMLWVLWICSLASSASSWRDFEICSENRLSSNIEAQSKQDKEERIDVSR